VYKTVESVRSTTRISSLAFLNLPLADGSSSVSFVMDAWSSQRSSGDNGSPMCCLICVIVSELFMTNISH
jgi:hypothetical protein